MKVKTSITLSEDLLDEIASILPDASNRSAFIEQALREHLSARKRRDRDARDSKILEANAEALNEEAADVLAYQVDL